MKTSSRFLSMLTAASLCLQPLISAAQSLEYRRAVHGLVVSSSSGGGSASPSDPGSSPAAGTPAVQLSTSSLTFGAVSVGASVQQSVQLSNTGDATLSLGGVSTTGTGFSASTACGATLVAGASCITQVTFAPDMAGAAVGALSFSSNAAGSPHVVSLSGTGAQAVGSLTAQASADFGTVTVGLSQDRSFTFTNTGNAPAHGVHALLAGADLSFVANTCGTAASPVTVAAGASCSMTVQWAPSEVAALNDASLTVSGSFANSPRSLALQGQPQAPAAVLQPQAQRTLYATGAQRTFALQGSGFVSGLQVRLTPSSGTPRTVAAAVANSTSASFVVPSDLQYGGWDIEVANPSTAWSNKLDSALVVTSSPAISSVSPATFAQGNAFSLTVSGTNLGQTQEVRLESAVGTQATSFSAASSNSLSASFDGNVAAGTYALWVRAADSFGNESQITSTQTVSVVQTDPLGTVTTTALNPGVAQGTGFFFPGDWYCLHISTDQVSCAGPSTWVANMGGSGLHVNAQGLAVGVSLSAYSRAYHYVLGSGSLTAASPSSPTLTLTVVGTASTDAAVYDPVNDRLYVARTTGSTVMAVRWNGSSYVNAPGTFLSGIAVLPHYLAVDTQGNLYVAGGHSPSGRPRVAKYSPAGALLAMSGDLHPTSTLRGLAVSPAGKVYYTLLGEHAIYALDESLTSSTVFAGAPTSYGTVDGPAASARFYSPRYLGFKGTTLFVYDNGTKKVRRID